MQRLKNQIALLFLIISQFSFGQTEEHKERIRQLEPDIWMNIWDKENSTKTIQIDSLSYDDIPKTLDFRGTVIEALKWTDSGDDNILILTITGHFNWKDYGKDSTDYILQDKSELYAYLFQKSKFDNDYKRKWRVYDYTECFGVDWFTGFVPKATTITDLDDDGIAEITLPYVSICRGGMDPGEMKIIMYEDSIKYALRGSTMLMCESGYPYGGEYKPSDNLKNNSTFFEFLKTHWDRNKCEDGKYY